MLDLDDQEGLIETHFPFPRYRGKVRDVYDLDDRLLIVTTDRISAFDWVLPNTIPDRGRVLTQLSAFWFERLRVPHHLLSTETPKQVLSLGISPTVLHGRVMVCRKTSVIPFECVVRGYLEGSGWREYQETGVVCGVRLPKGLQQCDRIPSPIFTPATKAAEGHDENVTFEFMTQQLGSSLAERLKDQSLEIYQRAAELAAVRGILIADTKFEWGLVQDQLLLIDEALTPDSSRFWPADQYRPGKAQPSFDKQFVREWLMSTDWDRNSPPPRLPLSIVQQTREKYLDALRRLTK
jgi:phosphoribosylaminoimidazole-succinocarboxamide synthase